MAEKHLDPRAGMWADLGIDNFPADGIVWPRSLAPTVASLEWLGLDAELDWEIIGGRLYVKFPEGKAHLRAKGAIATWLVQALAALLGSTETRWDVREEIRVQFPRGFYQPDATAFVGELPPEEDAETAVRPVLVVEVESRARGNRRRPRDKRADYRQLGVGQVWVWLADEKVEVVRSDGSVSVYRPGEHPAIPFGEYGDAELAVEVTTVLAGVRAEQVRAERAEQRALDESRQRQQAEQRALDESRQRQQAEQRARQAEQETRNVQMQVRAIEVRLALALGHTTEVQEALLSLSLDERGALCELLGPNAAEAVSAILAAQDAPVDADDGHQGCP
ncbi:MAG: Uma2 family endonuclease [Candidatus Schekmanbacteria bacterium]|nr:Uma2 family endonuclease [Candidatus Schekmanbacteria bacterium]